MLSAWMKINEVYHSSMFTKSLFAFSCFVVPNFYWCILTGCGKLSVMRMKNNFGHSCPMTFKLHFLWLSRNWITSLALIIWNQLAILWKFGLNLSSILRYFFLHILKVLHGLLVLFLKLFTLFFQVDYLFLQSCDWDPFSLKDLLEQWCWRIWLFEVLIVVKTSFFGKNTRWFFVFFSEHILLNSEFEIVLLFWW